MHERAVFSSWRRFPRGLGQGFQEGDEGGLVGSAEAEAGVGVFGEVGIEVRASRYAGVVVSNDFFERCEATVVHVGGGEGNVAQAGRGEFPAIRRVAGDGAEAEVLFIAETVVVETVVGKQGAAMAVKAIRAAFAVRGFVLHEKQLHAALFLGGELRFSLAGLVEFRVSGDKGEQECLQREAEPLGGDFRCAEGGLEGGIVSGKGGEFCRNAREFFIHLDGVLDGF